MTLVGSHVATAFRVAKSSRKRGVVPTRLAIGTRIRHPSTPPFRSLLRPPTRSSCCHTTVTTTRLFGSKVAPENQPGAIFLDTNEFDDLLDKDRFKATISKIRTLLGYPTYDVAVLLLNDKDMQETNAETRNVDEPTDVLSFPFLEAIKPGVLEKPRFDIPDYYNLGDVLLDVPYVQRQCEEDLLGAEDEEEDGEEEEDRGVSAAMSQTQDVEERLHMLLIHGMLHLVGYDHMSDDEYQEMIGKEEELLQALGLPWKKQAS